MATEDPTMENELYLSSEEYQEILDKFDELALAGQLDSDSIRSVLADYNLTEDDFPIPEEYIQKGDDAYVPPETGDSGNSNPTDYSIYETGLNAEDGSIIGGGVSGSVGDLGSGGGSGGGSVIDDSNEIDTRTGGGGMREFPPGSGVFIPEGMLEQARTLINQGVGIRNLANALGLESRNQQDVQGPVNMTDAELNGLTDEDLDPNFTGEYNGQQYENGMLVSSDASGDLSSSSATGGSATGGQGGESASSASVGNIDAGGAGGAGGSGGNVTVNFGDGTGGGNAGYEKFFEMINSYIASGEPIKEGEVKGIYEQFIETSPQSADAIRSFLALDRPVSEDQAELKTDIYKDIIGDVREAQSPLMKSLTRRSEMQGLEAERLMGPLSFLEDRDATQAGYGQAVSGGRGLGNISEMLAGRQRAEQKNVNLQLASNLLGQQRATAGLMADVESGIYSRMAPDIGLDFGSLLGISGVDVQNILGERQSTRAAKAAERGANIKLGIEAAPTVLGGIKTGYDWIKGLGN
jgi:hypothetical protein